MKIQEVPPHLRPLLSQIRSGQVDRSYTNATSDVIRIKAKINLGALVSAVRALTFKNRILKARLDFTEGSPKFVIDDANDVPLECFEPEGNGEHWQAVEIARAMIWKPFNLASDRLSRFFLVTVTPEDYIFGFVVHHFISDAESVRLLRDDLQRLYHAFVDDKARREVITSPDYLQYLEGLSSWLREERAAGFPKLERYCKSNLRSITTTHLPRRWGELLVNSHTLGIKHISIDQSLVIAAQDFVSERKITMFILLLYIKARAMYEMTGSQDNTILVVCSCRDTDELERMAGLLTNSLHCCLTIDVTKPISNQLSAVTRTFSEAYRMRRYPFVVVDEKLRSLNKGLKQPYAPLFNFVSLYFPSARRQARTSRNSGNSWDINSVDVGPPPFEPVHDIDMSHWFTVVHTNDRLYARLRYSLNLYEESCIDEFSTTFVRILRDLVSN